MENSGGERQVDHDASAASPPALLDLLVRRLTEPAAVLDESLTVVAANDAFETFGAGGSIGEPLTAAVPALADGSFEGICDVPDEQVTVRTADDRWTEFGFDRHGAHVLCIGHDTTDRQRLADLQRATRELLAARTREDIATEIVATATEVLGLAGATVYLFDAGRNVLWPAGVAGAPGTDARAPVGGADAGVVREVFLEGAATTVEGGDRYQPLGDHGVLHTVAGDGAGLDRRGGAEPRAGRDPEGGDGHAMTLLNRLAATARAALERADHEAGLRERKASQRDHAARAEELERLLSVSRRVQRALIDADTLPEIEQRVCEALTDSEWLSFAWVGRVDGDTVEPRACADSGSDYLDDIALSTVDPDAPPAAQTAASTRPTTVDSVAEAIGEHEWARAAIARDLQSVVSVPLRADGVDYGVLTVYADRPVEWDGIEPVFVDIGDSVAAAIADRGRLDRLAGDTAVEVDLTVADPDGPLGRLAATLDVALCCEAAVPVDGTTTRCFLSVQADGERVADAAASVQRVDSLVALTAADRYELVVREPTVVGRVVKQGGRLKRARLTDGELSLTATLAADTDVRTFADRLTDGPETARLTARRHRPATEPARGGIRESLESTLTDRQLEALRTAYRSGFFEWPRETTGEGVADMLGVAQPTANRHLRVSQRKLLELVFEEP